MLEIRLMPDFQHSGWMDGLADGDRRYNPSHCAVECN